MKVAYIFATPLASATKLAAMVLPQLEAGSHGAAIIGMFFFDDNTYVLRAGDAVGERLADLARKQDILLMACDQCAVRRGLAEGRLEQCGSGQVKPKGLVEGAQVGCFPQLYAALGGAPPDYVITL